MNIMSLAYEKSIPPIEKFHKAHIIDLHCVHNIPEKIIIHNFPNLVRFRASHTNLCSLNISDCPNLEVVDVSFCCFLNDLDLSNNNPKLCSLDISSTKVDRVSGDFPNLEHLCAFDSTKISQNSLDNLNAPNLLSIEVSSTSISNTTFSYKFKKLERLRILKYADRPFYDNAYITVNLSELILQLPLLNHFFCGRSNVSFISSSSLECAESKLKVIVFQYPKFTNSKEEQNLKEFCEKKNICYLKIYSDENGYNAYDFNKYPDYNDTNSHSYAWVKSQRMLYGPWGISPNDNSSIVLKKFSKKITKIRKMNKKKITHQVMDNIDIAIDRMMGSVFGSALGDALGCSTEFTSTHYARFAMDCPIDIIWCQLMISSHSDIFRKGTPTDDTEQGVLIMRSLGEEKGDLHHSILRFAEEITNWSQNGIVEHNQQRCFDCGGTVSTSICQPNFLTDPLAASEYASKGGFSAGNGSVMRTACMGCFMFWDEETVIKYSKDFGQATHFDVRCAVCSILISLLISRNIRRSVSQNDAKHANNSNISYYDFDIDNEVKECLGIAMKANAPASEEYRNEIEEYILAENFENLHLSERSQGFVLRATGAAVLSYRRKYNYATAITEIIRYAGDADSNASVVGGLIGSVVGFQGLPKDILKYMFASNWVWNEFYKMVSVMGIELPPSPFEIWALEE